MKTGFENEYIQEIKEDKIYLKQLDTNSNILIELPIIPKKKMILYQQTILYKKAKLE